MPRSVVESRPRQPHRRANRRPGATEPVDRAADADRGDHRRRGPSNTGALTLATPGLALARRSRPSPAGGRPRAPSASTSNRGRVGGPRQQHLAARAAVERQHRAERDRVAQTARPFVHRDAHAVVAFAHV